MVRFPHPPAVRQDGCDALASHPENRLYVTSTSTLPTPALSARPLTSGDEPQTGRIVCDKRQLPSVSEDMRSATTAPPGGNVAVVWP